MAREDIYKYVNKKERIKMSFTSYDMCDETWSKSKLSRRDSKKV